MTQGKLFINDLTFGFTLLLSCYPIYFTNHNVYYRVLSCGVLLLHIKAMNEILCIYHTVRNLIIYKMYNLSPLITL